MKQSSEAAMRAGGRVVNEFIRNGGPNGVFEETWVADVIDEEFAPAISPLNHAKILVALHGRRLPPIVQEDVLRLINEALDHLGIPLEANDG